MPSGRSRATNLTGATWEQSWDDWSARRDAARKNLGEDSQPAKPPTTKLPRPVESPARWPKFLLAAMAGVN